MSDKRFSRREVLRSAGVLGGSLLAGPVLAACGREGSRSTAPDGADATNGSSSNAIIIGHQVDLTGPLASTGYWRRKALDAAAEWMNENDGIGGREVRIITEDTGTDVDQGVSRMERLIDQGADFIIGSQHGGIAAASTAVAEDTGTLYLPLSRTPSLTMEDASEYLFRLIASAETSSHAAGPALVNEIGERWNIVYADYAWGQQHRDAWQSAVEGAGATVGDVIGIPVDTSDHLAFLRSMGEADGIFVALLASDVGRAMPALTNLGHGETPRVLADAVMGVFDVVGLGDQVEGVWGLGEIPWLLEDFDTPAVRNMRERAGVDPEGREEGSGDFVGMQEVFAAWSSLSFLKVNVEGSGWEEKGDTPQLIEHAESNPLYEESELFPQGDLLVRPEDHQGFVDYHILRVTDGEITSEERIPREESEYDPVVDLTEA